MSHCPKGPGLIAGSWKASCVFNLYEWEIALFWPNYIDDEAKLFLTHLIIQFASVSLSLGTDWKGVFEMSDAGNSFN